MKSKVPISKIPISKIDGSVALARLKEAFMLRQAGLKLKAMKIVNLGAVEKLK